MTNTVTENGQRTLAGHPNLHIIRLRADPAQGQTHQYAARLATSDERTYFAVGSDIDGSFTSDNPRQFSVVMTEDDSRQASWHYYTGEHGVPHDPQGGNYRGFYVSESQIEEVHKFETAPVVPETAEEIVTLSLTQEEYSSIRNGTTLQPYAGSDKITLHVHTDLVYRHVGDYVIATSDGYTGGFTATTAEVTNSSSRDLSNVRHAFWVANNDALKRYIEEARAATDTPAEDATTTTTDPIYDFVQGHPGAYVARTMYVNHGAGLGNLVQVYPDVTTSGLVFTTWQHESDRGWHTLGTSMEITDDLKRAGWKGWWVSASDVSDPIAPSSTEGEPEVDTDPLLNFVEGHPDAYIGTFLHSMASGTVTRRAQIYPNATDGESIFATWPGDSSPGWNARYESSRLGAALARDGWRGWWVDSREVTREGTPAAAEATAPTLERLEISLGDAEARVAGAGHMTHARLLETFVVYPEMTDSENQYVLGQMLDGNTHRTWLADRSAGRLHHWPAHGIDALEGQRCFWLRRTDSVQRAIEFERAMKNVDPMDPFTVTLPAVDDRTPEQVQRFANLSGEVTVVPRVLHSSREDANVMVVPSDAAQGAWPVDRQTVHGTHLSEEALVDLERFTGKYGTWRQMEQFALLRDAAPASEPAQAEPAAPAAPAEPVEFSVDDRVRRKADTHHYFNDSQFDRAASGEGRMPTYDSESEDSDGVVLEGNVIGTANDGALRVRWPNGATSYIARKSVEHVPAETNEHPDMIDRDGEKWVWNGNPRRGDIIDRDGYDNQREDGTWRTASAFMGQTRNEVVTVHGGKMVDQSVTPVNVESEQTEIPQAGILGWSFSDVSVGDKVSGTDGRSFGVFEIVLDPCVLGIVGPDGRTDSLTNPDSNAWRLEKGAGGEFLAAGMAKSVERHKRDIDRIGDVLIEESIQRDWCSEYDQVIDRLNPALVEKIKPRNHTYTVSIQVLRRETVTFEVPRTRDDADQVESHVDSGAYDHLIRAAQGWSYRDEFERDTSTTRVTENT